MYLQIKSTKLGSDYNKATFARTPIGELYGILEFSFSEEKRAANIQSIATAKLAMIVIQVAQGFAGSKTSSKVKLDDLLPFALNISAAETESETTAIISKMAGQGKIPIHVLAAISKVISVSQSS